MRPGLDELDGLLEADAVEDVEDPGDLEAAGLDGAAVTPAEHEKTQPILRGLGLRLPYRRVSGHGGPLAGHRSDGH